MSTAAKIYFSEVEAQSAVDPLRWGFRFAVAHLPILVYLAAVLIVVEASCDYVVYNYSLLPKEAFLLGVVYTFTASWVLTAVYMLCIESFALTSRFTLFQQMGRALKFVPKPLLSFSTLIFLVFLYVLYFPPSVVLVAFFIWAPAFCVAECYVKDPEPDEEGFDFDEDDFGLGFGTRGDGGGRGQKQGDRRRESDRLQGDLIRFGYFRGKAPWDLGLVRSLRFVFRHPGISIQLFLLLWFAEVGPRGVVALLRPDLALSTTSRVFEIAASGFCTVFVLAVSAYAFLVLLPDRAREEIELDPLYLKDHATARISGLWAAPRLAIFILLSAISGVASWGLVYRESLQNRMPNAVQVSNTGAALVAGQIELEFRLEDPQKHFRWLDPGRFELVLERVQQATTTAATAVPPTTGTESASAAPPVAARAVESEHRVSPREVGLFDSGGRVLIGTGFRPHFEPIRFVLKFRAPEDLSQFSRKFVLMYDDSVSLWPLHVDDSGSDGVGDYHGGRKIIADGRF